MCDIQETELWDVYDADRIRTGRTVARGSAAADAAGVYHMVIHVCIFNARDEMLIQQRQPFKRGWSNLWDVTVGGSAVGGDSSRAAAERELFEELGLRMDFEHARPAFTINFDNGFDDFYLAETEVDLLALTLQYEEVQRVKWASKAEIFRMMESGEFIPYHTGLIEMCFAMRGQTGAIRQG